MRMGCDGCLSPGCASTDRSGASPIREIRPERPARRKAAGVVDPAHEVVQLTRLELGELDPRNVRH